LVFGPPVKKIGLMQLFKPLEKTGDKGAFPYKAEAGLTDNRAILQKSGDPAFFDSALKPHGLRAGRNLLGPDEIPRTRKPFGRLGQVVGGIIVLSQSHR
jgi:hypothetical protein